MQIGGGGMPAQPQNQFPDYMNNVGNQPQQQMAPAPA